MNRLEDRITGILIGTAVGDAIGLPYEGISRRRAKRLLSGKLRHRLFFGRGMVSDDRIGSAHAYAANSNDYNVLNAATIRTVGAGIRVFQGSYKGKSFSIGGR